MGGFGFTSRSSATDHHNSFVTGTKKRVLSDMDWYRLKDDLARHRRSAAVGLAIAVPTIAEHSLSAAMTAEATSVAVCANMVMLPLTGFLIALYADYYMQINKLQKKRARQGGLVSPEEKNAIWQKHSKPLAMQMGVGLVGAHLFDSLSHIVAAVKGESLGNLVMNAIWPKGAMPYSLDLIMMLASSLGMAFALTLTVYAQKNARNEVFTTPEIISCFLTGLFAGAALSMIPSLINQHTPQFGPAWGKHIVSGIAAGAAVGTLFTIQSKIQSTHLFSQRVVTEMQRADELKRSRSSPLDAL